MTGDSDDAQILKSEWSDDGIIYLIDRLLFGKAESQISSLRAIYNRRRAWCYKHPSMPFRGTIRFDLTEIQRHRTELLERMQGGFALPAKTDFLRSSFLTLLQRLAQPGASFAAADVACSQHDSESMAWHEYAHLELYPLIAEFSLADWEVFTAAWPSRSDSWRKNILSGISHQGLPVEVRLMLQAWKATCVDEDLAGQIDDLMT